MKVVNAFNTPTCNSVQINKSIADNEKIGRFSKWC